jgi:hypothetical protein
MQPGRLRYKTDRDLVGQASRLPNWWVQIPDPLCAVYRALQREYSAPSALGITRKEKTRRYRRAFAEKNSSSLSAKKGL